MTKVWLSKLPDGNLADTDICQLSEKVGRDPASVTPAMETAYRDWAWRKAQFELCRKLLVNPALSGAALEAWQMKVHFVDYQGPPMTLPCRECDEAALPDRHFRGAWVDNGTAVIIDMPKARLIHMNRIRVVRNAELVKLDIPHMTALSRGDVVGAAATETQKQVLRDIPHTFSLAGFTTPETLKAAWPAGLPR